MSTMKRPLLLLGLLAACTSREEQVREEREEQVAKCEYLAGAGGVGECLVSRYDWAIGDADRVEREARAEVQRLSDSIKEVYKETYGTPAYARLNQQGEDIFGYLARRYVKDTSRIRAFGGNLCGSLQRCTVRFWSEQPKQAFALPVPPSLAASQVAWYIRDGKQEDVGFGAGPTK